METPNVWQSNFERFWAGMKPLKPGHVSGWARWYLGSVKNWKQLFAITKASLLSQPALGIAIDGGTPEALENVRVLLISALPEQGLDVHYRWIPSRSQSHAIRGKTNDPEREASWPRCKAFQIVHSTSVVFPAFWYDVVFLLPPPEVDSRRHYWDTYLESAWIVVVWQDHSEEQLKIIEALVRLIGERAGSGKCTPWLFIRTPQGELQWQFTMQAGVRPLPDEVCQRVELTGS